MKTSSIQNSILGLLVIGMIGCVPTQTTRLGTKGV